MVAVQSEVFEALRSINIEEATALKAAGAHAKRDDDVITMKADIALMKWMLGFVLAFQVGMIFKLFAH